ncbi:MAG: hypothetical protein PHE63_10850 [Eubacteriales bacterium]|nr:hypothetical protein [Eubacteriales bacterium]
MGEGTIQDEQLIMITQMTLRSIIAPALVQRFPDAVEAAAVMDELNRRLQES